MSDSYTVDFPIKPREVCDHKEAHIELVQGEPVVFQLVCSKCDEIIIED